MKCLSGTQVFEHLENFFNMTALDSVQNSNLPLILQPASIGGSHSTTALKVDASTADNTHTEFQLPLKGFYRHFKEMTETSGVTVEDAEIYFPQETPKTSGIKRPTRSTPGNVNNLPSSKRRK
jgi:hypothetical protein